MSSADKLVIRAGGPVIFITSSIPLSFSFRSFLPRWSLVVLRGLFVSPISLRDEELSNLIVLRELNVCCIGAKPPPSTPLRSPIIFCPSLPGSDMCPGFSVSSRREFPRFCCCIGTSCIPWKVTIDDASFWLPLSRSSEFPLSVVVVDVLRGGGAVLSESWRLFGTTSSTRSCVR